MTRRLRAPRLLTAWTLSIESLEARRVMDANPSIIALDARNGPLPDHATVSLQAGSPLLLPLDGFDVDGGGLTYTVTSGNQSAVTATLAPASDKWARITVENYGTMLFHLFDSKVPRVTSHFEELAAATGYYNLPTNTTNASPFDDHDNTFHRVVNGFVIQGGDREGGNGTGGSPLGTYDDQYSLDLQHNRAGILAVAKSTDDTGDSQFFITDGAFRSLDFNYSIFGVLVEGESVRAAIEAAAVNSERPQTPIKITSIEIVNDSQNQVVLLKAPAGVTSGTSQVTVRATDPQGNFTDRIFNINVVADDANGSPFLNDVPIQHGFVSTPKTV